MLVVGEYFSFVTSSLLKMLGERKYGFVTSSLLQMLGERKYRVSFSLPLSRSPPPPLSLCVFVSLRLLSSLSIYVCVRVRSARDGKRNRIEHLMSKKTHDVNNHGTAV